MGYKHICNDFADIFETKLETDMQYCESDEASAQVRDRIANSGSDLRPGAGVSLQYACSLKADGSYRDWRLVSIKSRMA